MFIIAADEVRYQSIIKMIEFTWRKALVPVELEGWGVGGESVTYVTKGVSHGLGVHSR